MSSHARERANRAVPYLKDVVAIVRDAHDEWTASAIRGIHAAEVLLAARIVCVAERMTP